MSDAARLPNRQEFAKQFAYLFENEAAAKGVVGDADLDLTKLPLFGDLNMELWWGRVYDIAEKGVWTDGLTNLLRVAAKQFPGRDSLKPWRQPEFSPENRSQEQVFRITTTGPLDVIQWGRVYKAMMALQNEFPERVLFDLSTQGSENYYFSIKTENPADAERFFAQARESFSRLGIEGTFEPQPYNHGEYYVDPVTMEGPDGQRFEADQLLASTRVQDIARQVMNEYPDVGQGGGPGPAAQSAVVDLVRADGSIQRLDPRMTLHEAGVRPGLVLRVHPERTAGAVNPLMRDEALARVRVQVIEYATSHPGFEVTANSPVAPTEYVFRFTISGFGPPMQPGGPPGRIERHEVFVYLPPDFPVKAPEAWWRTEIFHPNIERKSGWVCLGPLQDFYQPGLDFAELCQMLVDIAGYRLYSTEPKNFLDAEAAVWAHSSNGQAAIEAAGGISIPGRVALLGRPERNLRLRRLEQ